MTIQTNEYLLRLQGGSSLGLKLFISYVNNNMENLSMNFFLIMFSDVRYCPVKVVYYELLKLEKGLI